MSIFDDIKTGLNQAIDFEKGKGTDSRSAPFPF